MKKSILNIGKPLNKNFQKNILGGFSDFDDEDPGVGECYNVDVFPPVLLGRIPCNRLCPNGLRPFCFSGDSL